MLPSDVDRVLDLLREFAEFEKLSEYCTATPERFHAALFGANAFVSGLVAQDDGNIVAYTIFYPNFATFRGERGLYLEDIYITASHQRKGIGKMLLSELARVCLARGFERIDFQVLDWNVNAIDFYRSLGAISSDGETHFVFRGEPVRELAREA
jgi:ribosomal protein S18 acetylase RimI-like enzyme